MLIKATKRRTLAVQKRKKEKIMLDVQKTSTKAEQFLKILSEYRK